jgi:hypothetical protein
MIALVYTKSNNSPIHSAPPPKHHHIQTMQYSLCLLQLTVTTLPGKRFHNGPPCQIRPLSATLPQLPPGSCRPCCRVPTPHRRSTSPHSLTGTNVARPLQLLPSLPSLQGWILFMVIKLGRIVLFCLPHRTTCILVGLSDVRPTMPSLATACDSFRALRSLFSYCFLTTTAASERLKLVLERLHALPERVALVPETNRIHLVLFDVQNRTSGPYLAATHRTLISLVARASLPAAHRFLLIFCFCKKNNNKTPEMARAWLPAAPAPFPAQTSPCAAASPPAPPVTGPPVGSSVGMPASMEIVSFQPMLKKSVR